jgi:hypothetical protein
MADALGWDLLTSCKQYCPYHARPHERGASVSDRTCSIDGCAKRVNCRGLCGTHYQQWRRHGDPYYVNPSDTPHGACLAFIELAAASQTDECVIWPFADNGNGYGVVLLAGAMRYAHRLVLERTAGPAPGGTYAAHAPLICHNRACVNPRHLRWATPTQNSADKLIDGVTNRGERHGNARLTATQVLAAFSDPRSTAVIAADFGVSRATIVAIKLGRTWGWLTHTSKAVA